MKLTVLAGGLVVALSAGVAVGQEPPLTEDPQPPPSREEPGLPPGLDGLGDEDPADEGPEDSEGSSPGSRLRRGLGGFWEVRAGPRLRSDPVQSKDFTLAETRFQIDYSRAWRRLALDIKGDVIGDAVTERGETDLRQLRLGWRPGGAIDLSLGRQILTWGTGDLVFINDLFPKDWQAFLIGRDIEYLKAPSDALRFGWFSRLVNVDLVYTPRFDPDRYVSGERLSFWSPISGEIVGDQSPLAVTVPDEWLSDDEIALRLYRSFGSWELALYGYDGFWKSPGGFDPSSGTAIFPRLRVPGASVRGPAAGGIGNIEVGYYDSLDDSDGRDPFINNSELRILAGWERELARELTGGFQVYLERLLDYAAYLSSLPAGDPRDRDRVLLTLRLTRLLQQQRLRLTWFSFWSPTDKDAYLRPEVSYRLDDHWTVAGGFNWFVGSAPQTFFGQFENNTNVYGSLRFAF